MSAPLTAYEQRRRMSYLVHEIGNGRRTARDLKPDELHEALTYIFEGKCSEAQAATFLVALRIKGSSDDERYGMLDVLREYNQSPPTHFDDLVDYSGFYDGREREMHFGPATALVAVAAGARVVLTGGDSRNCNTMHRILLQDVLAALGIGAQGDLETAVRTLGEVGVGYVNTHDVNRALNNPNLDRIRQDVGLRTPINTMEISLNPLDAPYHMRGLFHPRSKEQVPRIMARSSIRRGILIRGIGGSPETPIFRRAQVFKVADGAVEDFTLDPAEYGLGGGSMKDITSPGPADQAERTLAILEGVGNPVLADTTVLNAGLALYAAERAGSIEEGIAAAHEALRSPKPIELLDAWRKATPPCQDGR